jgi:hypothetical protein
MNRMGTFTLHKSRPHKCMDKPAIKPPHQRVLAGSYLCPKLGLREKGEIQENLYPQVSLHCSEVCVYSTGVV